MGLALGLATLVGLTQVGAARADDPVSTDRLGMRAASLSFPTADGKTLALRDLKDKKAVVLVFLSFECPNSNNYSPILADMARSYAARGVAFLGVCCAEEETPASVVKRAESFKLGFPVYKDKGCAAAEALKAEVTPEAFLLDANLVLRYRGRIDNSFAARLKRNLQVTRHDLRKALDEVLDGKQVTTAATEAVGCPIRMPREIKTTGAVTYHRDVLPILQKHCQNCHRPGEVGPFSLMNYRQAVNWASDIKDYTRSGHMPPWKITEGLPFHNERRLTEQELTTLAAWADGGTPEGDPREAPPARAFTTGWQLGQPDLVLTPSEDFVLGPDGRDMFRCLVLPTNLPEDKYVVAVDVRPGNPAVVHHTLNFIDTQGEGRRLEASAQAREKNKKENEYDRGAGYSVAMGVGFIPRGGLSGWAPGQMARWLPEGYGWRLPRGADVVVQVHYHRNGRVERDRTSIGLYFAKKSEGMKPYKGGVIPGQLLFIPPGSKEFKVDGSVAVREDCVLRSIMPHMHLLGRQIKVTLTTPEGESRTLLAIKDWDYNWQETYFLREPLALKAGSRLRVDAVYDNSSGNPNNPNNPPRIVTAGEQTTNEMCFVFLGATSEGPSRSPFGGLGRRNAPPEKPAKPNGPRP